MNDEKEITEVLDAIGLVTSGISQLKSLGVIRSQRAYADLAEWFVKEAFGGTLAPSRIHPGWDVECGDGLIQVRSHSKAASNQNRWSGTKGAYDRLAVVVFDESLHISEFYCVPSADVARLQKPDGRILWNDLKEWRRWPKDVRATLRPLFAQPRRGGCAL